MKRRFARHSPKRQQQGFTVAEVALALVVFTMMTVLFAAVLPTAVRGARDGNNYNQAALLAQRKLDQLRAVGYANLTDLNTLKANNIVNAQNGDGSFDFTAADNLTGTGGFFPDGSTGTITVGNYSAETAGGIRQVTVTLKWTGTVPGTYSASALIISMVHR